MKAVIFDLDGVIVNTDKLYYNAWKMIAYQEKIEFNHVINQRLRDISRMDSLSIILENAHKTYTDDEKLNSARQKSHYYIESLKSISQNDILPGILYVISALKTKGVKIAV